MLRRFPRIQVALLATGLLAALPIAAHHSFAIFNRDVQVTLTGTVKEFQWTNPHVFIQLVVKNAEGVDEEWSIEGASPNMLFRSGWTNQSFKPGDKVTLVVNPLRDGTHGANFVFAELPDGKTLGQLNSRAPG
ncbi:MAG: DUF6152 family protein [Steroidobacteraceae bacterium]